MTTRLTVLIAAPDLLPVLREQIETGGGELLAFTDAEALKALEVILKRRPSVVALERLFAATARGAALISRLKADPTLSGSEVRVVSRHGEYVLAPPPDPDKDDSETPGDAASAVQAKPPVDHVGTRRATRHRIAPGGEVTLDGNQATLVDLSTAGAQVVSDAVLRPNQRVRIALADDQGAVRLVGTVAWASFEITPRGPRYRAGIAFLHPNAAAVDVYCLRHRAS